MPNNAHPKLKCAVNALRTCVGAVDGGSARAADVEEDDAADDEDTHEEEDEEEDEEVATVASVEHNERGTELEDGDGNAKAVGVAEEVAATATAAAAVADAAIANEDLRCVEPGVNEKVENGNAAAVVANGLDRGDAAEDVRAVKGLRDGSSDSWAIAP